MVENRAKKRIKPHSAGTQLQKLDAAGKFKSHYYFISPLDVLLNE